jgi:hypothetical protein
MSDRESGPDESTLTPLEAIASEMGDPGLFPTEVHRLYNAGKVRQARKHLLKHSRVERSVQRAAKQREVADDLRFWLSPVSKGPGMFTFNGIGTRLIGRQQEAPDGTYIGTLWFTIVFLPVWAISSYLVLPAEKGWHFLAKTPLPTAHRLSRWLVGAVAGALVVWAGAAAYTATTHTDLFVYNGFDRPLFAQVNGTAQEVQARSHALFQDLPLEPTDLEARWEGDEEPFEELQVDLAGQGRATIVYNVASRGLIAISYVLYGAGQQREDEWLDAGPVLSVERHFDFRFSTPPDSVMMSGDGVLKSWLHGVDDGGQPVGVVAALIAEGRKDQALAMARAELEVSPSNALVASVAAGGVFAEDADGRLEFLRSYLDRAPEEVDLHRVYQDHWPEEDRAALRAEYDSLLASHESSAMYHYLAGRIQETGSATESRHYRAALALDPEYGPAFRGMAYSALVDGNWSEALAHCERFATLGPDEALEMLDSRLRLGKRIGQEPESGLRILEEALEHEPESLELAHRAAHYAVEIDPEAVDATAQDYMATLLGLFPVPRADLFENNLVADLAITAGDLETARTRLAAIADPQNRRAETALRLALSTGATDSDRQLLLEIPNWFDQLEVLQPIALELIDTEAPTFLAASTPGPMRDFAQLLEDEERLIDPSAFDQVAPPENLLWRSVAAWAAARRLGGVDRTGAERARRWYSSIALGFALPGDLPFTGG